MSNTKPTMDEIVNHMGTGWCGNPFCDKPNMSIDEAKLALTACIDDIVKEVVGEDELSASIPLGMSETQHLVHRTRDSFRADQRSRYQTIKQERGL